MGISQRRHSSLRASILERLPRGLAPIVATGFSMAASRGVSLAVGLVTLPIVVRSLGPARFGVWLVLAATLSLVGFVDLGLGNGLVSAVAAAEARSDEHELRRLVNSALFGLLAISSVCLVAFFVVLFPHVDWRSLFGAKAGLSRSEVRAAVAWFVVFFLAGLPAGVFARVEQGLRRGHVVGAWTAAGAVMQLVAVVVAASIGAGLPGFVIAMSVTPVIASVGMSFTLLRSGSGISIAVPFAEMATLRRLVRNGFLFFVLSMGGAIAYETDTLIIARIVGPEAVAQYGIAMRVFMFLPGISGLFLIGLWPAYAHAIERRDLVWIRRAFRYSILGAASVNSLSVVACLLVGQRFIRAWAGSAVVPSSSLQIALAFFVMVNAFSGPFAMLMNGLSIVRFQVYCTGAMAVANLAISVVLAHAVGTAGPVFGTVIAQTLFILVPASVYIARRLSQIEPVAVV